jgi:hypothetical protein
MDNMEIRGEPPFRLKPIPLLVTAALGFAVPGVAGYAAFVSSKIFHTPSPYGPVLPWLYMQHGLQLLLALVVIAVLKRRLVPADYGLHWPRGKTYILAAVLWGVFFGVLMTAVDYAPQLIAHTRPNPGFPLTPGLTPLCGAHPQDPVTLYLAAIVRRSGRGSRPVSFWCRKPIVIQRLTPTTATNQPRVRRYNAMASRKTRSAISGS